MTFSKQVVVVTGAAGALGKAVAEFFHEREAKVVCIDLSIDAFNKTYSSTTDSDSMKFITADLTNRESVGTALNQVISDWGRIDALANVAGGFTMGEAVHETSDETWDFLVNLNTKSIIHTAAVAVPQMIKQGRGKIVNISAGAAHKGLPNMGTYVASKSAVLRLTESMAMELRDKHINVNAILPGTIDTERNRQDMPDADFSKWVAPEKIAEVIGFLCSGAASEVHGAGIPVIGQS